jgi:GTPase SAR1 family protein
MNKDLTLKSNIQKFILLIVGNDGVGKKSIARKWANKYKVESEENRSFYYSINFLFDDKLDDENIKMPVEIRILNGDEISTNLKNISSFFKNSLGAFVVTSISDNLSFQE